MASAWTRNGPISLPSRPLAYGAGIVVALFAVLGITMGFEASLRKGSSPEMDAAAGPGAGKDDALVARPVVDMAPPAPPPEAAGNQADDTDDEDAKADALAAQTAAAQAIQAKPSKGDASIDDVLTSPTEKPPPPVKTTTDEAPPGTPVKTDVPF